MSYAKQMADMAAEWSRANPPPFPVVRDSTVSIHMPGGCTSMDEYRQWAMNKPAPDSGKLAALGEWCVAWDRCGRNVFDLSPDFVAAMLLTDPTAIVGDVRMPFGAILLTIPSGFALGTEGLPYTKVHVFERLPTDGRRTIVVQATDGVHCLTNAVEADGLTWDAVEGVLNDDGPPMAGYARVDDVADDTAQRTIAMIVFGLLGYVSSAKDAVTPHAGHRPARRRLVDGTSLCPVHWEVGRNVKIDRNLVQAARGGSREIAVRIKHRFIVRGHYRHQAHGPDRMDRRVQWIAPHWKGPESGAQIVHTYKPQAPATD